MADGFEDSPNMVPGDVEVAKTIDKPLAGAKPRNQKLKLIFAIAALAVAGGWSYANQDELKGALGYETADHCAARESERAIGCCSSSSAAMAAVEGESCPMALAAAGEMPGTCCEQGQKSAMMAALLAPVESEVAEADAETEVEDAETTIDEVETEVTEESAETSETAEVSVVE